MLNKFKNAAPFWKGFFIVLALLLIVSVVVWVILWNYLIAYQETRPTNVMELLVEELNKDEYSNFVKYSGAGELDEGSQGDFLGKVKELVGDSEISYMKAFSADKDTNPAFSLNYGDKKLAKVVLEPSSDTISFDMHPFKIKEITEIPIMNESVKITAPSGYAVYVNDKCVSDTDKYIVEKDIVPTEIKNVPDEYLEKPTAVVYEVKDLYSVNSVTAKTSDGEDAIVADADSEGKSKKVVFGHTNAEDEYKSVAMKLAKLYSQFVTGWVGQGTILSNVLPNIQLREDLAGIQTGFYTDHKKDYFINEKAENVQIFAGNCFSCDISYTQVIEDIKTNHSFKQELPASYTFTFVQKDGKWYIADLVIR